jgi:predicted phage-related endonuclease
MTTTQQDSTAMIAFLQNLLEQAQKPQSAPVDSKFEVTAEFVEVPKVVADALLAQYHAKDEAFKAAKKELETAKQSIINAMGKAEVLVVDETGQEVVTHRVVRSMIVDTARLRKEQPQIAAEYQKERVSRPLDVLV